MTKHVLGCIAICLGQALAAPAWALSLGMTDTFAGGADGGWSTGVASIAPPVVVADGGPAGTGDGYLRLTSLGGAGASSKLSAIAGAQRTGDYLAAGVDRITLDLLNLGRTDLSLRLWLSGLRAWPRCPPGPCCCLRAEAVPTPASRSTPLH